MADIPAQLIDALADRYSVEREIGVGGMATVYLADDLKHRRKVAIKVLRPELAKALGTERFLLEIKIAASLTHPHILPLHDSGEAAGFLYYVMPFIDGESLRGRIKREGHLTAANATRIFCELVEALGEAHDRGIVHRDVKPENVLLTSGHALVADFGVARAVTEATTHHKLTTAGVALGTPQYMAPEQAAAEGDIDHRADLFAAGAIFYELLTGLSPFAADNTRAVFAAVMTRTPVAPHEVQASVPEALSALVMKTLEKDPERRPQSARELLDQLEAVLTPPSASPASALLGSRKGRRVLVAAAILVMTAGSVGTWQWNSRRSQRERVRSEMIPEVLRLVGENQIAEAAQLAFEAEAIIGNDPVLEPLWARMSSPYRIVTDPPGAEVSYRTYGTDADFELLGTTPLTSERFPVGAFEFRITAEGYEPVEVARSLIPANQVEELANSGMDYLKDPSYSIDVQLSPVGALPEGMIAVSGGLYGTTPLIGFGTVQPVPIPAYLIDRTEVTVRAYAEFVQAGAYADPSIWTEPFVRDGAVL